MKYRAVIFDLDGTLTYTLDDLMQSVNHALRTFSMPERTLDEVRRFVGNGVRRLMELSVPAGTGAEEFERCFAEFKSYYVVHCQDNTRLYDGVKELLVELRRRGYLMAIVSNKMQSGVDEIYRRWFADTVHIAIGECDGVPRKPAPDMVHNAMSRLGVTASETIYVGDSDVDVATARNSGLPCISVLWGFRDRQFLESVGATTFVERPEQILGKV